MEAKASVVYGLAVITQAKIWTAKDKASGQSVYKIYAAPYATFDGHAVCVMPISSLSTWQRISALQWFPFAMHSP